MYSMVSWMGVALQQDPNDAFVIQVRSNENHLRYGLHQFLHRGVTPFSCESNENRLGNGTMEQ